eukprot:TRINITY_DN14130_c0_g1_i1.p1 TRINITY_DN14130_c0_g1~~TRINITY_DN14130_c0_g1_i1.p1  ORF type:complete len:728 (-),score=155.27 TRINITY_DN14130_c0_g1_i1:114-2297(-)
MSAVALPVDIYKVLSEYLYHSDQSAFGKFRIAAKGNRDISVRGLTNIEIRYGTHFTAEFFAGAAPHTVSIHGVPDSEKEALYVGSLLSLAKEVSFELENVDDDDASSLEMLGSCMSAVTALEIDCGYISANNVVCSWLPHTKNLTRLDITWNSESSTVLEAAAACSKLEFLRLQNESEGVMLLLRDIAPALKGLKALKTLVLPELFFELSKLRISVDTGRMDLFEKHLDILTAYLPNQLQDLHDVYVRANGKNTFDVHIIGVLYTDCSYKTICDFLFAKLKEFGVDRVCDEYGDTVLTYLLSASPDDVPDHPDSFCTEQKIESLLDAGADPLRRGALPGISGKICWGNVFHAAAMYGITNHITNFISMIEKRDLNATVASMKTSEGFTPLHFVATESDSWIALSDYFKQFVSEDMLTDNNNILGVTPLAAIHHRVDPNLVAPLAVVECTEFMLGNKLWKDNEGVKKELSQLFPTALDFYASYLGTQPASDPEEEVDEEGEEVLYPIREVSALLKRLRGAYSGNRLSTPGASLPVAAKRLSAAFILCPTEAMRVIVQEATQRELSAALVAICSMGEAKVDTLESAITELLKAGAQATFTHSDICNGFTALGAFVATHTPMEENIVEEYYWQADCQAFWKVFWQLANAGVLPSGDGESSIFGADEFSGVFLRRADQAAEVDKLRQWLTTLGASEELENLENFMSIPHEEVGASDEEYGDGDEEDGEDDE